MDAQGLLAALTPAVSGRSWLTCHFVHVDDPWE